MKRVAQVACSPPRTVPAVDAAHTRCGPEDHRAGCPRRASTDASSSGEVIAPIAVRVPATMPAEGCGAGVEPGEPTPPDPRSGGRRVGCTRCPPVVAPDAAAAGPGDTHVGAAVGRAVAGGVVVNPVAAAEVGLRRDRVGVLDRACWAWIGPVAFGSVVCGSAVCDSVGCRLLVCGPGAAFDREAAFAGLARRAVRSDRRRSRVDCNCRRARNPVDGRRIHGSHDRCSRRRAYPTKATMSIRACATSSGHSLPVRCQ